jgi:hypothetical protein
MKRVSRLLMPFAFAITLLAVAAHGQSAWDQQKVTELASQLTTELAGLEDTVADEPDVGEGNMTGGPGALPDTVRRMHEEAMGLSESLAKGDGRDATHNRFGNLKEQIDDLQVLVSQMMVQDEFGASFSKVQTTFGQLAAYYPKM